MKKCLHLYVIITLCVSMLSGCSELNAPMTTSTAEPEAEPKIISVTILSEDGFPLSKDDAGWVELEPKCIIEVSYEGKATKAKFYYAPTGSEVSSTLLESVVIGSSEGNTVSIDWEPYDDFLGHVWVVLWNGDISTTSEITKAYFS